MSTAEVCAQIRRFAASGVLATGIHTLIAIGLVELAGTAPAIANGAAFLSAAAFSYAMNTFWSFAAHPSRRNMFRFALVSTIGSGLAFLLAGTAERLGLHYLVGIGLVVLGVPTLTFLLHRNWTYR